MVSDVTLENFKGIDQLKINDFSRINVFVGRNETGKSTILEALSLCLSLRNDYKDNLGRNILTEYILSKYSSYSNIIKMGNMRSKVSIDGSKQVLEIVHEKNGLSGNGHLNEKIANGIGNISQEYAIRQLTRISHKNNEKYVSETELKEEIKQAFMDRLLNEESIIFKGYHGSILVNVKISYTKPIRQIGSHQQMIFDYYEDNIEEFKNLIDIFHEDPFLSGLIFYTSERNIKFKELHDIAVNQKSIGSILEKIKKEIDYVQDLRMSNGKFRLLSRESDIAIPLEVRGDGLKSFIYMMFMENILKNGVIILEEPENYLHPGLMGSWCADVISKDSTNQYFISTHSCELLEYMLENEILRKDLKIFKMYKDPMDYEAISGDEAYERVIELKEDLRGI